MRIQLNYFLIALFAFLTMNTAAQTPNQLISRVNREFGRVNDFSADILLHFDIPEMNVEDIGGRVYFKQPDKFRIKTEGIIFLPKQHPYSGFQLLRDTTTFTSVGSGTEICQGVSAVIINIIPHDQNSDLVLGKFWLDTKRNIILKTQLTTKTSGTIITEDFYSNTSGYPLPYKMVVTVDVAKFKFPKAVTADINSKKTESTTSNESTGTIALQFSNYEVNKKLDDKVFNE